MTKTLKEALDDLALSIASHVASDKVIFADRLDAFKALTAYQLGLTKVGGKKPGESNKDGENFDAFRKQVEAGGE